MSKRYNVDDAIATIACLPEDASDKQLKEVLAMTTDIPEDRLDTALHELKQVLDPIRMMTHALEVVIGRTPTPQDIRETTEGSVWIDDDKKTFNLSITSVDEDGNEIASGNVKTKLD